MTTKSRTYAALPAPFGKFAHATVLPIAGTKLVFVSGVTARESGATDAEAQTRLIYERIQAILEEEGGGFQHVLKMNVFVLDIGDYPSTNRIRESSSRVSMRRRARSSKSRDSSVPMSRWRSNARRRFRKNEQKT
jgi:enamine deaminase RidA (YjgF/YER057c/UK114 family)